MQKWGQVVIFVFLVRIMVWTSGCFVNRIYANGSNVRKGDIVYWNTRVYVVMRRHGKTNGRPLGLWEVPDNLDDGPDQAPAAHRYPQVESVEPLAYCAIDAEWDEYYEWFIFSRVFSIISPSRLREELDEIGEVPDLDAQAVDDDDDDDDDVDFLLTLFEKLQLSADQKEALITALEQ